MPDLTGVEATTLAAAAGRLQVPAPVLQDDPLPHEGHHAPERAEAAAAPPPAPPVLPPAAPELAAEAILEVELEPPQNSTRELAGITADVLGAYPSSPMDVVQGVVQDRLYRFTAPQRGTVDLAVDFGCVFRIDQLGQWNKRPLRPCARTPEPDVEADVMIVSDTDRSSDSFDM